MRLAICVLMVSLSAAGAEGISLPPPETAGGKPLMQALKLRASTREYRPEPLPPQVLSNLLWAAFGINRENGGRTAPSAHGKQEVDVYAVLASGTYRYDAKAHRLDLVTTEDLRVPAGTQDFVKTAPLNLIYVADTSAFEAPTPEEKLVWTGADAGVIAQNVYLFCASEGLGAVVRGGFDREALTRALKLKPHHRILLAQTAGYPMKPCPEVTGTPAEDGSVITVRNREAQPLSAFLVEIVDYPGSRFSHLEAPGAAIAPGQERRVVVRSLMPGTVPDYLKVTAAVYAGGGACGSEDKVQLLRDELRKRGF